MKSRTRTIERDRPRLTGRAAALLIVVGVLTIVSFVPARHYLDLRSELAGLDRQAARLEQQNANMRSEISKLHDTAELERLARACLGMVRPGEIALVLPGSTNAHC